MENITSKKPQKFWPYPANWDGEYDCIQCGHCGGGGCDTCDHYGFYVYWGIGEAIETVDGRSVGKVAGAWYMYGRDDFRP